jgi:hypothetical protein
MNRSRHTPCAVGRGNNIYLHETRFNDAIKRFKRHTEETAHGVCLLRGTMNESRESRPFQYGIGTLLGLMFVVAVVFGLLRWMGATPGQSAIVLGIVIVSLLAAVALIAAISKTSDNE